MKATKINRIETSIEADYLQAAIRATGAALALIDEAVNLTDGERAEAKAGLIATLVSLNAIRATVVAAQRGGYGVCVACDQRIKSGGCIDSMGDTVHVACL